MDQSANKFKCSIKIPITIGFISILAAIGMYFFAQPLIRQQISQNLAIKPNSMALKYWIKPPAIIYRKYYLFDIKNPEAIQLGKKPKVVQLGPYVYREFWEKKNVEFLDDYRVRYKPSVSLIFEPSLSQGSESDKITFLNIPAAIMIEKFSNNNGSFAIDLKSINDIFKITFTELFVTKTVGDLISGYTDLLLTSGKLFNPQQSHKFSLVNGKNGTTPDEYVMMTGYDDASNIGKLISWNGLKKLNFWNNENANKIKGTDGSIYPPFLKKDKILNSYNPDMCRSYKLTYLKDNKIDGLKTYEFHLPENTFNKSSLVNEGFCDDIDANCDSGVFNLSKCNGGISFFISQPHFLNAEQKFVDSLIGLKPDKNIHDFIANFEPIFGLSVRGSMKLQLNFYLFRQKKIDLVKNVKPVMLPIFWFDETFSLEPSALNQMKLVVFLIDFMFIFELFLVVFGFALIVVSYLFILKKRFSKDSIKVGENVYDKVSTIIVEPQDLKL